MKPGFTYKDLNARFAGKMLIIAGSHPFPIAAGVCKLFAQDNDLFTLLFDDGRAFKLHLESFQDRHIKGVLLEEPQKSVTIETMLSLKTAVRYVRTLEEKPKDFWNAFAGELQLLIPESCKEFVKFQIRNNTGVSMEQAFPDVLKRVVQLTQDHSGYECFLISNDLAKNGFVSFDDAKVKLSELSKAWKGVMRIDFKQIRNVGNDNQAMPVWFYASEYERDRLESPVA